MVERTRSLTRFSSGFCRSWHDDNVMEPVWRVAASRYLVSPLKRGSDRETHRTREALLFMQKRARFSPLPVCTHPPSTLAQHFRSLSRRPGRLLEIENFSKRMNISFDRTDTIPIPLPQRHRFRVGTQPFRPSRASFSSPSSTLSPSAYCQYHQHEPSLASA